MDDELKIKIIMAATGCTLEEARLAWSASEQDEEKALELVDLIKPQFLAVKIHFTGSGMISTDGLAVVVLEHEACEAVYTSTVVINYSDEPIRLDLKAGVVYWQQLISSIRRDQNRHNIESSLELKEYIETRILPETGHRVWLATRELKELESSDSQEENKATRIKELERTISSAVISLIESFYKQPLNIEAETELFTKIRFTEIARSLGLSSTKQVGNTVESEGLEAKPEKKEEPASLQLKGKVVLDIIDGLLARDLKKGDKIAVDIIERTEVAENLARMLGLNNQDRWQAAWGMVVKIEELQGTKRHILVEIARHVFIETVVMNDVRIKSKRKYPGGNRKEYILETPSAVPGYLMVGGMALFFSLLVKIFMEMVNR